MSDEIVVDEMWPKRCVTKMGHRMVHP